MERAVLEGGRTTVPARVMTSFVAGLPEQDLELSRDPATQTLRLLCDRFDTHVKCEVSAPAVPAPLVDMGAELGEGRRGRCEGGRRSGRASAGGALRGAVPCPGAGAASKAVFP